jgi:hypothetical protein
MKGLHRILIVSAFSVMPCLLPGQASTGVSPILNQRIRVNTLTQIEELLSFSNPELKDAIPSVSTPFFFEQPLLLVLRAPGGIKQLDMLKSMANVLQLEISGSFVRGNRSVILLKNGGLLSEGDTVTRSLPNYGGMATTATIAVIDRNGYTMEMGNSRFFVDLSKGD